MRKTPEDAARTRQALLDAALMELSRKGYQATRLQDVAEAANLTRGAIYHHFRNKAELYLALLTETGSSVDQVTAQALAEGGSLEAMATRVLVRTMEHLEANPSYRAVVELTYFRTPDLPELEPVRVFMAARRRRQLDLATGLFAAAKARGEVRRELDPGIAARAYLAYVFGVHEHWLIYPEFRVSGRIEEYARVFLRGLLA